MNNKHVTEKQTVEQLFSKENRKQTAEAFLSFLTMSQPIRVDYDSYLETAYHYGLNARDRDNGIEKATAELDKLLKARKLKVTASNFERMKKEDGYAFETMLALCLVCLMAGIKNPGRYFFAKRWGHGDNLSLYVTELFGGDEEWVPNADAIESFAYGLQEC